MTGNQHSHVTVKYTDSEHAEIMLIYAIDAVTIDAAKEWAKTQANPTAFDFHKWLRSRHCGLDCIDGPAMTKRCPDGATHEQYYRNGKLHREDGPAVIIRDSSGFVEKYFREGKRHRVDGPAYIYHYADGSALREYYLNDSLQRRETNSLVAIPGVQFWHPLPVMPPGPRPS